MTNEVKKVLAYFEKYVKITNMHDSEPMLNWKDLKIVLDYITDLQDKELSLENKIDILESEILQLKADKKYLLDYKSRIDKVIEYNYELQERYCHSALFDELVASKVYEISEKNINILQGEDNE